MDEGTNVISPKMISMWAVRPVLIDLAEDPKSRKMSKDFNEGRHRRTSTKGVAEGFRRRASPKDLDEGLLRRIRRRSWTKDFDKEEAAKGLSRWILL